ncbi:MAG: hypothetical protein CBE33_02600 [Candidatus Pelagibacter sp. TMED273]|jgi:hypothetical protein|nr:MAG: hypothetical protein CBE33_02600 [Candidatus Pelagibacter sp. TMED273]|tara:strand:+ start:31415 stop:32332 length:918 start_codon:yes stop_codon:yes gene_type:complete
MKLKIILQSEFGGKQKTLDFDLYQKPIVTKVLELLDRAKQDVHSSIDFRIDSKQKQSDQTSLELAMEMNRIIDTVNSLDCVTIPDSCYLETSIDPHLQTDKLNHLHLIFQEYSEKYGVGYDETQELLERVNILVHLLESAPVEMDQVFIVAKQEYYRPKTIEGIDVTLTDEDHDSRLPWGMWGYLELDYNTVGKDLGACFGTDDVVLATEKADELRQQETYAPVFAVNFVEGPHNKNTEEQDKAKIQEYYAWCSNNNVPLNYLEPKYKVGRIRLGELSQEYSMEQIQQLTLEYPNIVDIVAINDK